MHECFIDENIVDATTNGVIGSASDCFSPLNPEGTKGIGTTYFFTSRRGCW